MEKELAEKIIIAVAGTAFGSLVTALVSICIFRRRCRFDSIAASRKAATDLYAVLLEAKQGLRPGNMVRPNISYTVYSAFLLSVDKKNRSEVERCWQDYIDSKNRLDYIECSLNCLMSSVEKHT